MMAREGSGNGIAIVLGTAAVAGLVAVSGLIDGRAIPEPSIPIFSYLTEAGLALLLAALVGLWQGRSRMSSGCAVAALILAGVEVTDRLAYGFPGNSMTGLAPPVLTAVLSGGVFAYQVLATASARFMALATVALCCGVTAASLPVGIAIAADALPDSLQTGARMLSVALLSGAYVAYLAVAPVAPASTTLRWLRLPIAIAGIVGSVELLSTIALMMPADARFWAVTALIGAICAGLTASVIANCSLGAVMLDIDSAFDREKRTFHRHRQHLQEQTLALEQSQRRYKELFRSVEVAVLMTHPSGTIIAANPAMLELLGVDSEDDLNDVNFRDVYADPDERASLVGTWHASRQDLWKGEINLRRRDGEEITALYTARLIRGPDGEVEYHQGLFTDITALRRAETERRALEMHLRLSQKLESVGRLAVGIAHEINTPMQYMGDNVYFLRQAFESLQDLLADERRLLRSGVQRADDRLLESLGELEGKAELDHLLVAVPQALNRIADGIDAVSSIVVAIKELAHPVQHVKVDTDLNALVRTALVVTSNEYKTVAGVETDFTDVPTLPTHKNELCQVFINLIVNAAHAIETAKRQDRRPGLIRIATSADEGTVRIRFRDNGCGIPAAALDKIFDPFFTTKEVGKGTGQGLAIASRAIDRHGGRIEVESSPGVGSSFTVVLPVDQSQVRFESVNQGEIADG